MKELLLVFAGSGAGGCLRFAMAGFFRNITGSDRFPLATLSSNILACLLAGWLLHRFLPATGNSAGMKLLLLTGFCGGFSTFSALSLETVSMLKAGQWMPAILYILTSLAGGLTGIWFFARHP